MNLGIDLHDTISYRPEFFNKFLKLVDPLFILYLPLITKSSNNLALLISLTNSLESYLSIKLSIINNGKGDFFILFTFKNVNIKNYPSNDHVLHDMMEEIQRYFENLQDKTLSEHPEIAFDECYCELYMENHFENVFSKYFNNNDVKNKILNLF